MIINSLSEEQSSVIEYAKAGKNVLVDACIGSGKTTTIQELCNQLSNKKILYLTYNKLLKEEARKKIRKRNVEVTNYHGFAWKLLKNHGISVGVGDMIQEVLNSNIEMPFYDVLIIDEYQDIEQEFAEMLQLIKSKNHNMQIIMVGDMQQKIYDKTTLDVKGFAEDFLEEYVMISFTKCFRLSEDYAAKFGIAWSKKIVGVNNSQTVEFMTPDEVVDFLAVQKPEDVLCLGSRGADLNDVLNELEEKYPDVYNKSTVYASIKDDDSSGMRPKQDSAIFTTYDSSKGLEKPICVLFDFQYSYWKLRANNNDVNLNILKNIFCVAASRGKEKIIFVERHYGEKTMNIEDLKEYSSVKKDERKSEKLNISDMFDFKYIEDIEKCYKLLDRTKIEMEDKRVFKFKEKDELIDLAPCIGIYQEASYFNKYDIDSEIDFAKLMDPKRAYLLNGVKKLDLEKKILSLTAFETRQFRYVDQVDLPIVSEEEKEQLHSRLDTIFNADEDVQINCTLLNEKQLVVVGRIDVLKNGIIYELKFTSELKHTHFLQLACYLIALNIPFGRLWNVKTNEMWEVRVPDKKIFLESVVKTVSKGQLKLDEFLQ